MTDPNFPEAPYREKMSNGDLPESPTSITYSIITPKGFPALLTLRDAEYKALTEKMSFMETYFETNGYKPQIRSFGAKKEVEYVKDSSGNQMLCPTCKKGYLKVIHSAKGTFYGCDQSKYDPATKSYVGCKYFTSNDPTKPTPNVQETEFGV